MKKTLIIGYGNIDRQDDGLAWHILLKTARHYGFAEFEFNQEHFTSEEYPHLMFDLQLAPEMSEIVRKYDQVLFVDAHTGAIADEISWIAVTPEYKPSAFTHHMSPETVLSLAHTIYSAVPETQLLSVRGYNFGFGNDLSARAEELAQQASDKIIQWLSL